MMGGPPGPPISRFSFLIQLTGNPPQATDPCLKVLVSSVDSTVMNSDGAEAGFTLVELLVTVLILGILSAIAIPNFLSQRDGAYHAQMGADLRNAAIRMEQQFHVNGGTYTTAALDDFRATRGVLTVTQIRPDGDSFCLTSSVDGWGSRTYDSSAGGVQPEGVPC